MITNHSFKCHKFLVLILAIFSYQLYADDVLKGEQIFKQNCTACHMITDARLVGPGLQGVTDKYEKEWLIKWIRNSQELIASGDERAIKIYEEYNKTAMSSFYFSDVEFSDLLAYLADPPIKVEPVLATNEALVESGMSNSTIIMIVALILLVLVFVLSSVKNSLKESLGQNTESISEAIVVQKNILLSNNAIKLFIALFIAIVLFKFTYDSLMGVGVTTNYQPAQPIEFSHKVHAGLNGVDCNYCHTSARKSKHSGIPSANVCMNCHTYINEGAINGKVEIQKIYDAIGFDSESRTYIPGYEKKPIEWVRIHNLPDHAYFNHSQHVVVGGLECNECHGPVEEMDVVYQYSELTMGWCIECHRETEVKMEGNGYYTHLHEQLKEKYKGEAITVAKMGGLECSKCHY